MSREADLKRFYDTLAELEQRLGGTRRLENCDGRMDWPKRGVYFFFEPGEYRTDSGEGLRVVRVGTHALTRRSRTTLWTRLSQHRGVDRTGSGNHRGSVFRLLVGAAIKNRDGLPGLAAWGIAGSHSQAAARLGIPADAIKGEEHSLETAVSRHIRSMPFLSLAVEDDPGPASKRAYIERNAIAVLSNYGKSALDPPSPKWLGHHCERERVRYSGLWNSNHVDNSYEPSFLNVLEEYVHHIPAG